MSSDKYLDSITVELATRLEQEIRLTMAERVELIAAKQELELQQKTLMIESTCLTSLRSIRGVVNMGNGLDSRLRKLQNRRAEVDAQLYEVLALLEENTAEVSSLSEELRLMIGDHTRPKYLIDKWNETLRRTPYFLSLTPEDAIRLLIDKGDARDEP